MFAFPLLDVIETIAAQAVPSMPPDYWWVTVSMILILALASLIDAFVHIIPDILMRGGLLAIAISQTLYTSWSMALFHLGQAFISGILIWAINQAWYRKYHVDALGMGDAKWTMLAVACFGALPVLMAWGFGAVLATVVIGLARMARHPITQVTFGPYLFIGLCVSLYWIRFSPMGLRFA